MDANRPSGLFISAFGDRAPRHGGVRRSAQLRTELLSRGFTEIALDEHAVIAEVRNPRLWPLVIWYFLVLPKLGFSFLNRLKQAVTIAALQLRIKRPDPAIPLIIEYSAGTTRFAPWFFARAGVSYTLATHNIEFLVPRGSARRQWGAEYELETAALLGAEACIAICAQDAAIASVFCPVTTVYTFAPSPEEQQLLADIQTVRAESMAEHAPILVLGSAINPPTCRGMKHLLAWLSAPESSGLAIRPVQVVGFATDQFFRSSGRVKVLGTVTDEHLRELLCRCALVLLYQPPTTGFLTRLVEMSLAGVPVLINGDYMAARNLERYGIYCYEQLVDIPALFARVISLGEQHDNWPSPLLHLQAIKSGQGGLV